MDEAELLRLFWTEVREYLGVMNNNLMALEMSPDDANDDAGSFVERLRELNRVAHSLKGAARAVGRPNVETLGHHMEEVFEAGLKRGMAITPDVADHVYDALDLVQRYADGEPVDEATVQAVVENLRRTVAQNALPPDADVIAGNDHTAADVPRTTTTDSNEFPAVNGGTETDPNDDPPPSNGSGRTPPPDDASQGPQAPFLARSTMSDTMLMRPAEDTVRVSIDKLDKLMRESSQLLVTRLQSAERTRDMADLRQLHGRWAKEWRAVRTSYIRLARRLQNEGASDDLRDLLAFLETNQRYLTESAREVNTLLGDITNDSMRLATLTDEIQANVGSLRLVSFDSILGTLHRTLRDAARETGKEIHLDVLGSDTDVDKRVLDHLKDPIMHLIRNAVDHGIEPPAQRAADGKPEDGWVSISVETRGSEIAIMVADDGRGIDAEQVRQSAMRAGIVSASATQNMSDDDLRALIFHPGLSTRSEVTALSGRGVGMDVVRNRVEGLRGRVSVTSTPGEGTTVTIRVPLSLTRIRSVMMRIGREQYVLPSLTIQRMERLPQDAIFTAEGRPVVTLGERALPLVSLGDVLNVPTADDDDEILRVLVLNAADRQIAFAVDELLSEQELVLKPLGDELANTPYISGAALLGNGEVVLMLDANDLVRGAVGARLPQRQTSALSGSAGVPDPKPVRVLIADDSITTRTLEKNILETAGCDVRVAFDGVQAWDMLSEAPFDVVISDVEMPRMDGLTLTERIKSTPTTKHLPVILLTSLTKPEHQEAGLQAGADAYLVKSRFDQDELLRAIQSVL